MNFRRSESRPGAGALAALLAVLMLAACSGDRSDLEQFVAAEKAKKPGPIEPLPQIKPYETFVYDAQDVRSPFTPDSSGGPQPGERQDGDGSGIQPDFNRPKEYLEQFSLDGLQMVGTIEAKGQKFALVADPDGAVHRVLPGNYLGQNHGKITGIGETEIRIMEIIPDGLGGWMEHQAAIGLDE